MLLKGITALALAFSALFYLGGNPPLWQAALCFAGAWLGLLALAFLFLWALCLAVDMDSPQEKDSPFYRRVMHVYIEALISLIRVRLHTQGLENTPKEGRFFLVCNHLFVADPGVLLHCFRKNQLAFVTKRENERLFLVGKIMHKILCQSIDRENDRSALKTIRRCIELIRADQVSIAAFPEGYTSRDGKLHPFRPGVFRIAQKTGVPIVVCTIQGTRAIVPNLLRLRHTDVSLHLVEVIPPEEYTGRSTVDISRRVYESMIADLGEDFRYSAP